MMNRGSFKRSFSNVMYELISPDYIMDFLSHMRKAEYYSGQTGMYNRLMANFHGLRQRKLGLKLGFNISRNTLEYGVVIPHYGTIVVGGVILLANTLCSILLHVLQMDTRELVVLCMCRQVQNSLLPSTLATMLR